MITLTLSKLGQKAIASGAFSDVWKLVDEKHQVFAGKAFRVYERDAVEEMKKV